MPMWRRSNLAKTLSLTVLGAGILALGSEQAAAAITAKVKKACKGDYKRLCPTYKVGSPQLRACMEAKGFEISSRCVDALIESGEVNRGQVRR